MFSWTRLTAREGCRRFYRYLAGSSLLKEDTVLIVEAALDTDFSYLDEYGMTLSRLKMYKTNEHAFIRRK